MASAGRVLVAAGAAGVRVAAAVGAAVGAVVAVAVASAVGVAVGPALAVDAADADASDAELLVGSDKPDTDEAGAGVGVAAEVEQPAIAPTTTRAKIAGSNRRFRSEEHTSELQSRQY